MRRRKPKTLPLSPKSSRTVKRLAMAIAFEKLSWSDQNDRINEARGLLEHLASIV